MTRIRDRWSRKRSYVPVVDVPDNCLTQQQFKADCDMNRIVKNAMRGVMPAFMARGIPQYGDFSEVPSLAEARDLIEKAEEAFEALPAALRRELGNDPVNIQFLTKDQVDRYGLGKVKKAESEAEAAPLASPPPEAAPPEEGKKKKKTEAPPTSET